MKSLTELVREHQQGRIGEKRVVDSVCEAVYRYPLSQRGFSEEDCAEFLIRFYPRITRLIRRYRHQGSSFESYLATTLRYQLRSFASARGTDKIRLAAAHEPAVVSGISEETDVGLSTGRCAGAIGDHRFLATERTPRVEPASSERGALTAGESRRLLCMGLKAAEQLSDAAYKRLAEIARCDEAWLHETWQSVRDQCDAARLRRQAVRKVRDRAWFKTRCAELRLRAAADETERESLRLEWERWNRRLERARRVLSRMPVGPTHQQIADALGVPKGTIDSSVFKAKRELADQGFVNRLATLARES